MVETGNRRGVGTMLSVVESTMATKKAPRPPASEPDKRVGQPSDDQAAMADKAPPFEEIAARVREREAEVTPARRAMQEKQEQEALAAASVATVDEVVRSIGELRVGLNRALDFLSADLVSRSQQLTQLEWAIGLRSRQLAEFYEIEVAADTLASLVATHDQRKTEWESLALSKAAELEHRLEERQRAWEAQAAEARAAWEAEKKRWMEDFGQEQAEARTAWEREKEDREYAWKLRLKREEETYQARRSALEAALTEERARTQAEFDVREQRVAAQEREMAELRARVEGFTGELEGAVRQARLEVGAQTEERTQVQMEMRAKDAEANEKLLKLRISGLEQSVKDLATRNEVLQRDLHEATDKVRDIAMKAIEGASGSAALARVSEIALQHAKARET